MFRPRGPRGADRREFRLAGGYSAECRATPKKSPSHRGKRLPEQDLGKVSEVFHEDALVQVDGRASPVRRLAYAVKVSRVAPPALAD
jgi:hypothetical protein